jgi:tRNA A-37 threonylcarbamoyl transferase component Bud32
VIKALDYLHKNDLFHGDLSCANIVDSEEDQVVVDCVGFNTFIAKITIQKNQPTKSKLEWLLPVTRNT